ncbi:Methylated-DNA--protein-cysteine methyltransferase [Tenacibaculum maritimum]|nr:methylated-DNA--[protein]-cysteine S-methyltransferase [Tenacibaculum maritimum]CAA0182993.1 Methylated-DNA--protein-cysteine methyltransferase [Tenacibaculum maritimum]CAA0237164.1 Methylated-DNA--protein-cysteine methyltransferase [Tenacibaculum maritimum]
MEIQTTYYKTPIGFAKITGNKDGIQTVSVLDTIPNTFKTTPKEIAYELQECVTQLDEYFKGKRIQFNLKLNPQGTSFQQRVWKELLNIPYNKTKSYLEQAKSLGDIKAIRAVASANGKNPIWIIIPCHRVIGSDGSLTGYAGGIWRKKWLLAHENPVKQQALF